MAINAAVPLAGRQRRITILGSTGSVGRSTVDLLTRNRDKFTVEALTANRNAKSLAEQAISLDARFAAVADPAAYPELKELLAGTGIAVGGGPESLIEAADRPTDLVMAGIVGAAGLAPTLTAIRRGRIVALANKEALVCAGGLFLREVKRHGATLLPVDSEHNAIWQCFDFERVEAIDTITLTASGGPFREFTVEQMRGVSPQQAVAHPVWSMGAKISIDSATLFNKGLEIIEAHHLFQLPSERIGVVVHPQSIVHGFVTYKDGSVLAHMGSPDMRTPISYVLGWPERTAYPAKGLDLAAIGKLTFEPPDEIRFPALKICRAALISGGCAATVLNAANETAVYAFMDRRIGFLDIAATVEETLAALPGGGLDSLDDVYGVDRRAREIAGGIVASRGRAFAGRNRN